MNKQRKQIRLKNYDYSQSGLYFVTICAQNRECLFGNIVGAIHESPLPKMVLIDIGKIIDSVFKTLPDRFPVILDAFQIMPNHIHMIIQINHFRTGLIHQTPNNIAIAKSNRHMGLINQTPTLGHIIRNFKSKCTYKIHKNGFNNVIWQRNYYEHIIRTENDLNKIREYVNINPLIWDRDRNNLESKQKTDKNKLF